MLASKNQIITIVTITMQAMIKIISTLNKLNKSKEKISHKQKVVNYTNRLLPRKNTFQVQTNSTEIS